MTTDTKDKTEVGPEQALLEYAMSLRKHVKDRRAVLVRVSRLTKYFRQPHHLRTAAAAFEPLLTRFDGRLFEFSNHDIVLCIHGASISDIDDVIIKVRYMFRDDENLTALEAETDDDVLCRWFDIEDDYKLFLKFAESRVENAGKEGEVPEPEPTASADDDEEDWDEDEDREEGKEDEAEGAAAGSAKAKAALPPAFSNDAGRTRPSKSPQEIATQGQLVEARDMTVSDLSKLVRAISTTDIEPFIQRSNVVLVSGEMDPRPVLSERQVSVVDVREAMLPSCREDAEPFLKRYLQQTIDRRAIQTIDSIEEAGSLATSLRATMAIVESQDFKEFEKRCVPQGGHRVVLEFSIVDVLLDVVGYLNVRAELRAKGYRVMIGDMDPFAFISLDRMELPCDFEKVRWEPSFEDYRHARPQEQFRNTVEKVGSHRVILADCVDARAFDFGQDAGINLYAGPHVEALAG